MSLYVPTIIDNYEPNKGDHFDWVSEYTDYVCLLFNVYIYLTVRLCLLQFNVDYKLLHYSTYVVDMSYY